MNPLELLERHWHALYVRSRSEKKVLSQLEEMGVEAYLPLVTKVKQWSDRRKKIEEPLFKSYVFVRSNAKEYLPILNVYGVLKFVTFEREAVVVPDNQIAAIKKFVEDYEHGEEYKIGRLETIQNKRHLIVYIEVVGQYIPVHLPRAKVEPVIEG